MEKCPKKVDDEFNMGIGMRKAAYIKYGQTVPLKYAIDAQNCLYLTKGKCRACEKYCPTGAINFTDTEKIITINVGAIILAPGFSFFDPSTNDFYGYGKIADLVTGLEYERLLSASGPHMGHLVRPSDGREPRKIAWIQCAGSRNTNRYDHGYCSSVCCMYAIKQALVTSEHLSGAKPEQTIFNIDIRTHGKEFERYYESAKEKGIRFINARPRIIETKNNIGVNLMYFSEDGRRIVDNFDMVVLSVGLEAPSDGPVIAHKLGFELNHYRFAKTTGFEPVSTTKKGIFVAGAFNSPKDIPQSVTEASCAADEAASLLAQSKGTLTQEKIFPPERDITGEDPRIGVFVCSCGINIANVIDVKALVEFAGTLPRVVLVENNLFTCSTDTQNLIAQKIRDNGLNRIVVAACTPRTHEDMFQNTLKEAGLNAYLMEMANIRNQNAWVHQNNPQKATEKAKDQIRMAVAKAAMNYPLTRLEVPVNQKALVLGGGISGMTAVLDFADRGYESVLIEQTDRLGGVALGLDRTWRNEPVRPLIESLIQRVYAHASIRVFTNAKLTSCSGSVGHFKGEVASDKGVKEVDFGVAVVATGAREYQPREYGYGEDERIMTQLTFEHLLNSGGGAVSEAKNIVFIQCVGSRVPERPYCSRLCCTHAISNAIRIKEKNPAANVFVLNRDIRTYGLWEDLYRKARELGVVFIRYTLSRKPLVLKKDGGLTVDVYDTMLRHVIVLPADYIVLSSAVVPHDNQVLVDLFKCGVNADGFINEAHPKLRPVDMTVDGLFVAGLCHYPKPIDESIVQAKAAVSRACVLLSRDTMLLDAVKSYVTDQCDGCAACLDVCPYKSLSLETVSHNGRNGQRVRVDAALCKGCGLCQATCPKEGILIHGFTLGQLKAQADVLLGNMKTAIHA